jgi:2-C-methyl-D-erythritol 4-phosphate cytidylyltransferase
VPKQFLEIEHKAILLHTIDQFVAAFSDIELVIVLPEMYINEGKKIIEKNKGTNIFHYVVGGETRFQSVKNGLSKVSTSSIVFVHDAVRCLLTPALVQRCYQQAVEKGSAIPAVSATDTIRLMEGEKHHLMNREDVMLIQTPQTFQSEILIKAFEQEHKVSFTDEANVVEASGVPVFLVEGEFENIKITRPLDMAIANYILTKRFS